MNTFKLTLASFTSCLLLLAPVSSLADNDRQYRYMNGNSHRMQMERPRDHRYNAHRERRHSNRYGDHLRGGDDQGRNHYRGHDSYHRHNRIEHHHNRHSHSRVYHHSSLILGSALVGAAVGYSLHHSHDGVICNVDH
ncbi:MAG: hypothetical protein ACK5ME_03025 [Parahaliea sp.]